MSNKALVIGLVVLVGGLLIFGRWYGGGSSGANNATSNFHGQTNAGLAAANQNQAPVFSLSKLGGGSISLAEYKSKKPVVVDFWASWCPNCRRDMPRLNSFYQKYKDKVEVIGVNLQEDEGTVRDFIASRGISFPIALDPSGQASSAFGIQSTNTHFLIDKDGNLVRTIPGDIQESDITSLIEEK